MCIPFGGVFSCDLHTLFANYTHARTHPHTCVYRTYFTYRRVRDHSSSSSSNHCTPTRGGLARARSRRHWTIARELIDCARGGQGLVGARVASETSGTVPSADDAASGRVGADVIVVVVRIPTPPKSDLLGLLQGVFASVDKMRVSGGRCICVYRVQICLRVHRKLCATLRP